MEKSCIAQPENDCVNVVAEKSMLADQPKTYDVFTCQLWVRDKSLLKARVRLTAAICELKSLHRSERVFGKQPSITRADMTRYTLLREESR